MRTIVEVLEERALRDPRRLAFTLDGASIDYGELLEGVRTLAGGLARRGLRPGSRCALVLDTSLELLQSIFAVQWLGAVPVAMNPALPVGLLAQRTGRLGCELALAEPGLLSVWPGPVPAAEVGAIRAAPSGAPASEAYEPGTSAYLQLTSGTTGEPQAVVVSHGALMAWLRLNEGWLRVSRDDVFATWVPLHHDMGLVRFAFGPLLAAAPCHLLRPSLANLRAWLETLTRERVTITGAPDFGYRVAARLVEPAGIDLTALRCATNGGEAVRHSTIQAFESRFGVPGAIRPGYGLAEATLGVSLLRPGEALEVLATGEVGCGRPYEGLEVRIDAGSGQGASGEILVRGAGLFDGYLGDPAATALARRDGFLVTGDVGRIGPGGQLFVLGRKRALIKRGGALIAPREAEEAVDGVPGVRLSAAIGLALGGGPEDLVVVAEVRAAADESQLRVAIEGALERALGFTPARVWLVPPRTIPRTPNGKTRYDELRRLVEEGRPANNWRASSHRSSSG